MKTIKNYRYILLAAILSAFVVGFSSCKDDESTGPFDTTDVLKLIDEAEDLIENSEEGILAGDFKPGAKKELQECVNWVYWKIERAEKQADITDAANKLQIYITKFKGNTVAVAIPWVKQEPGTYIELLDDAEGGGAGFIQNLTNEPFTLEAKYYIVDLSQRGYSNNMFAKVMGQGGANDRGFEVRYFGDGSVHVNIGGGGKSWQTTSAPAGTIKAQQWIHVSYVNSGSSQKLYIDGVEVIASNATYNNADDDFHLAIGNTIPWNDRVINAMVQDFRIWSGVRTQQQIADNKDVILTGQEDGLKVFFPFNVDLGTKFSDLTGNIKASFVGDIEMMADGIPPVIILDYASINQAIADATALMETVVEGTADGDYPVGTKDYLQTLVDEGNELKANANRQDQLDEKAKSIQDQLVLVNKYKVADTDGILIDRDVESAVGFRITPNYTPQGDYTVEFNVKVKALFGYGAGEFFNNGEYGIWVYGYRELTEENVLKSGGLWNFTNAGNGWQGPKTQPQVMKTGVWQHVAIVHDNTARTTKIFVDGVEQAVFNDIGAPNVSGWGEMWLGNGWGKMDGYIKDFRLWDVARDAAELDADIAGDEAGLHVYFPLDKVNGIKFNDVTGNYQGEMRGISWNQ